MNLPPAQHKHVTLVQLLYKKTADGRINWKVDDWGDGLFADFGGNTVTVSSSENGNFEPLITFALRDHSGEVKDRFNDEDLSRLSRDYEPFQGWYAMCDAIREMGVRKATGADEVIDAIISHLDDDVPF